MRFLPIDCAMAEPGQGDCVIGQDSVVSTSQLTVFVCLRSCCSYSHQQMTQLQPLAASLSFDLAVEHGGRENIGILRENPLIGILRENPLICSPQSTMQDEGKLHRA